jgi:hypothetical protein
VTIHKVNLVVRPSSDEQALPGAHAISLGFRQTLKKARPRKTSGAAGALCQMSRRKRKNLSRRNPVTRNPCGGRDYGVRIEGVLQPEMPTGSNRRRLSTPGQGAPSIST